MGTTGYCWDGRAEVQPYVETIPGATTDRFHVIAPEVDPLTELYHNSEAFIGPEGLICKHRKSHPYIAEPKWAASGDIAYDVYETLIDRIAMMFAWICIFSSPLGWRFCRAPKSSEI
jgi:predicted amidohydrolase